jgi:hypothetical protein
MQSIDQIRDLDKPQDPGHTGLLGWLRSPPWIQAT